MTKPKVCVWEMYEYTGNYDTSCGRVFDNEGDNNIENFMVCPYCGKEIEVLK